MRHQQLQTRDVVAAAKEFECPHADVAARHAQQHGARQRAIAHDRLTSACRRQRTRARNAERSHCLAYNVFAQHWTQGRTTITAARIRCATGALQLQVEALTARAQDLPEQHCAPVPELRVERPELMPGVRGGDGRRPLGHQVSGDDLCALGRSEPRGIDPELSASGRLTRKIRGDAAGEGASGAKKRGGSPA